MASTSVPPPGGAPIDIIAAVREVMNPPSVSTVNNNNNGMVGRARSRSQGSNINGKIPEEQVCLSVYYHSKFFATNPGMIGYKISFKPSLL